MKTRKIILLIVFILGIVSLWLMSSFTNRNACEYAASNIEYIGEQIDAAIMADDFEQSKYFAYKALNGIEKTKANFLDCGCDGAIANLETTLNELKMATRASSFHSSKTFLHNAMEHTIVALKVLRVFEQEFSNSYNNNILVMNTKEAIENESRIMLPHDGHLHQKVHNCLLGFQSSLDKVVTDVACEEARVFITKMYNEATLTLMDTELSDHKKEYHQRVRVICKDALERLGDCAHN
ncbi:MULTISPECIES: hypothetical protein [Flavobacteriaceae]|uniref:hypothetical protein n=1 Tax=Flavobacteriaceae TaxID=49546 RepID=UPI0014918E75|nr:MULTISPECIES: hypothetical protein [Allomuricauda]MDC6367390.1 hypothetical protein [Muricauda sp. AC10]